MKRMVAEIEGEHGVDKERVAAVRSQYTSVQNAVNGLIVDIEIVKVAPTALAVHTVLAMHGQCWTYKSVFLHTQDIAEKL